MKSSNMTDKLKGKFDGERVDCSIAVDSSTKVTLKKENVMEKVHCS